MSIRASAQRRGADGPEVLAHPAIDRGDAHDDHDRGDRDRQQAQELDHPAHARDADDRPDHRGHEEDEHPDHGQHGDLQGRRDAVDHVLVVEDRTVRVQAPAAVVAAGRELEHRDQRQEQVAEHDDQDRDPGAALAARRSTASSAALRRCDDGAALRLGSGEGQAGRAHQPTHREARRWTRAYSAMTTEMTTIIPSASALPTFSWPSTTSLVSAPAICRVMIGLPWLMSAAAVA